MSTKAFSLQRIQAVVIGASAGGVEALRKLLPALPTGLAVALFVVLHLPSESHSLLAEIFCPLCQLQVCEARGKDSIAPGTIYFAPSDYHRLFETAAGIYQEQLVGVILAGSNQDGAAGLADLVLTLVEMVDLLKTLNREVQI